MSWAPLARRSKTSSANVRRNSPGPIHSRRALLRWLHPHRSPRWPALLFRLRLFPHLRKLFTSIRHFAAAHLLGKLYSSFLLGPVQQPLTERDLGRQDSFGCEGWISSGAFKAGKL